MSRQRKKHYHKNVLNLLPKNDVKIYSTENEEKSFVCERWNRTIKTKMYKQFTIQNNTVYIDILPKVQRGKEPNLGANFFAFSNI